MKNRILLLRETEGKDKAMYGKGAEQVSGERIISDVMYKGIKPPVTGAGAEFNDKALAVNDMYKWLYEKGILEKESIAFHDFKTFTEFAVDVKDLEKYRKEMEESGLPGARLSASHIFDEEYQRCKYSGTFTLAFGMGTYRNNGYNVSGSWECDLVQSFSNEAANEIRDVKDKEGVRAAVIKMYSMMTWNEKEITKKPSLDEKLEKAESSVKKTTNHQQVEGLER